MANLTDRLETRKLVERAKGTLMTGVRDERAGRLQVDQRAAMDNRMTMKEVPTRSSRRTSRANRSDPSLVAAFLSEVRTRFSP